MACVMVMAFVSVLVLLAVAVVSSAGGKNSFVSRFNSSNNKSNSANNSSIGGMSKFNFNGIITVTVMYIK